MFEIPHLYLGKKLRVIPLDGREPFEDYLQGEFNGSHFVTSKGIEISMNGNEAIPTKNIFLLENQDIKLNG